MLDAFWIVVLFATVYTIVGVVGFGILAEKLLALYGLLFQRAAFGTYLKVWRELRDARKTLSKISGQDEFAKWARQQRVVDKLQAQYNQLSGERQRALMTKTFGMSLGLRIIFYGLMVWILSVKMFGKEMVCCSGGFFGPIGTILSFPKTPMSMMYWVV